MTDAAAIRVVADGPSSRVRWVVKEGAEAEGVLCNVPLDERSRILEEATGILGQALEPGPADVLDRTGLVVGYIQSGKTLSFTTVAALARDNGYPMVVLVAGYSEILLAQSRARLRHDLELDREAYRRWLHFPSPSNESNDRKNIEAALREWRDPGVPSDDRPTVLVTVMKNHAQLRKLADLLERLDLGSVTTLLIDDEADQASPNTRWKQGEESSTYLHLIRVRRALGRHTLLQYTATPQAPLLLSLADSLSPDFARVLTPGRDYVGGRDLFGADDHYVRSLSGEDVDPEVASHESPPPGLLRAMQVFFIGARAAQIAGAPHPQRAMLVHPSQKIAAQQRFQTWVLSAKDMWERLLEMPPGSAEREVMSEEFGAAREELLSTASDLPPLDALLSGMARLIRRTRVEAINAATGSAPVVSWGAAPAWILIGGQLLDRGFTVEGLTVTYMSRPAGVRNADTLQQRARFYGYKRAYLSHCRIFVEPGVHRALSVYVRHEEDIRASLQRLEKSSKPLQEWKRQFLLDPLLKPSRANVLSLSHIHRSIGASWHQQRRPHARPNPRADPASENRAAVATFIASASEAVVIAGRTPFQTHRLIRTTLAVLLSELLTPYAWSDVNDATIFSAALMQMASHVDGGGGEEEALVYQMRPTEVAARSLDPESDSVDNLFEGRSESYAGDEAFVEKERVTVQVHRVRLRRKLKDGSFDQVGEDVTALAIWLPKRMAEGWVLQVDDAD